MTEPANLTPVEWSKVLSDGSEPQKVAERLKMGKYLSWNEVLLRELENDQDILDLGSGRGENSAMLALRGKRTNLLDWSQDNLDFSKALYRELGKQGQFYRADMTKRLPFEDGSFDAVFSCGVFEYFMDEEIRNILTEAFRVSRKKVILLIPNALSIFYRIGKWYMEKNNKWPWGGEKTFISMKPYFTHIPDVRVREFTVAAKHSLNFLTMAHGKKWQNFFMKLLNLKDHSNPSWFNQGYLLISVAERDR